MLKLFACLVLVLLEGCATYDDSDSPPVTAAQQNNAAALAALALISGVNHGLGYDRPAPVFSQTICNHQTGLCSTIGP